ncbi:ribosome biogenesis GTP-binding protein YihA/YsxC [Helicobacter japonicus]|uniref:ribosome biogenesis GTP-binding protein YihA/YsxC n=1 Tax=Helicobacter japonicus TaxID=425400 RepID=UPI0023F17C07|nr:ribosome biogenesis GTP-binding protein YihA/YsxC [Helicobacter japonicus]
MSNIQVVESHFLISASNANNAPAPKDSEIVCLGRSNVGKSTFINTILNKPLAKSSATPGKTQLINFFTSLWIYENERIPLTFIDLPGFGYAKVSKSLKAQWEEHLFHFLQTRQSLKLFLHLVDSRHINTQKDQIMSGLLEKISHNDQYILRIYTKADKLTQNELNALKNSIDSHKDKNLPNTHCLIFSANTKNHRKMTSVAQMRAKILTYTLGLQNGV